MSRKDPDGTRLPVKLDTASNGEFAPLPLDPLSAESNRVAAERVSEITARLDSGRRDYLVTPCGAATVLATMNDTFAKAGKRGGRYAVPPEALYEEDAANSILAGDEFIFDVHLHHVNPNGTWRQALPRWETALTHFARDKGFEGDDMMACLDGETLLQEVFLDSDTTCAVLTAVPAAPDNPLHVEEAAVTRSLVEQLTGSRLLIHGMCLPNFPGSIERMADTQARYDVAAWKTYTQWGPDGRGFWLDDEDTGIRFIEAMRSLGGDILCVHKGIPLGEMSRENSSCRDIGVVAGRYPDVRFLVYHAGFDPIVTERAFDEREIEGVNSLLRSLSEAGIGPGGNVYVDLGTTWRLLMRDPDQAAHALGKLFGAVGEDNILWGTDSIWYGSPQDQIQAFRAFEISDEFQDLYGYPALTPERKRKILGLNAARVYGLDPAVVKKTVATDRWGLAKSAYDDAPDPSYLTFGPKTPAEFARLSKEAGGGPA